MGIKMGMHNPVTSERFTEIKQALDAGMQNNKAARKFGFSLSTIQKIRRSRDYHAYRIRADEQVRDRKVMLVVAPKSGLAFEDFGKKPIFSSTKTLTQERQHRRMTSELDQAAKEATSMAVSMIFIWGILLLIIGAALVVFIITTLAGI